MKPKGYYDLLLKLSDQIKDNYFVKSLFDIDNEMTNLDDYLIKQFNFLLKEHLQTIFDPKTKIKFLNKLLHNFSDQQFRDKVLLAIAENKNSQILINHPIRLSDNYLFTNDNEQALIDYLTSEIISCDEVYLIYPFIAKNLLNKLRFAFKIACEKKIPIAFISTTFDDLALFVNLHELVNLIKDFANITVRIEDNTEKRSERIHIKAALFHRYSGFSSALIGSSNLTTKGMITGREWNIKINEFANYNLYHDLKKAYEKIWKDNLVPFNDEKARNLLLQRLQNCHNQSWELAKMNFKNYYLYDFQLEILNLLQIRRQIGKQKHLVVMATGTGKTIISAFDYLHQIKKYNYQKPKLLFLAHQKEIIVQALTTFRHVLKDNNFGVLIDSKLQNFHSDYLFATIQTVYRHLYRFKKDQFDYIIFDEAHHIVAKSFAVVFNYFQTKEIIGLTATPEREDNQSILPYFDYEVAYELRLWTAINQRLLAKFDYYCIDDINIDLKGVDINNDQQVFKFLNNESRNQLLLQVIKKYIGFYHQPLTVIFCINTEHAAIIADFLSKQGLKATYLTTKNASMRHQIISNFKKRIINYLCVVNIFNEGVDVPEIDTIILLRPTNSRTVYLQQLGRGLRKTDTKNKLVVYDLISNIDQKYDIMIGFKNLLHKSDKIVADSNSTFGYELPYGCTITLEPRSKEIILHNLRNWYKATNRIHTMVKNYYSQYQEKGLMKLLQDYELDLLTFYQFLNNFYLSVALNLKIDNSKANKTRRNKNILKQFLFLNDFKIINYFYLRLKKEPKLTLNYHYDNLLICSLYYEVSSISLFQHYFSDLIVAESDIVAYFIETHQVIVKELIIILEYKLTKEELIISEVENPDFPLLTIGATYTIRQALCAIKRLNFINKLGILKIIAFQAGYLTYDKDKSVIFADISGNNYGKLTNYDKEQQEFYWSIPENKDISSKLVKDLENNNIRKFLFLNNNLNKDYDHLNLKLYDYIGEGNYLLTLKEQYITIKLKVIN